MGKRWWLFLVVGLVLLIGIRFVSASCTYCNGGVCNGICESGETSYCDDCNKLFCSGDHRCDAGLGETCNSCPTDCGYCDGHSCTSYTQCSGGYCTCGLCASSPPSAGHCCSDADCDPDYYGPWGTTFCGTDANVYHSRTFHNNYCSSVQQCAQSTSTDTALVQTCTSGCTGGVCNSCTSHDHYACNVSMQKIYWWDSCNNQQDLNDTCSTHNTVGPWGSNSCGADGNVYHNHTKSYYGCAAGDTACRVTSTEVVAEQVQTCSGDTPYCASNACVACVNTPGVVMQDCQSLQRRTCVGTAWGAWTACDPFFDACYCAGMGEVGCLLKVCALTRDATLSSSVSGQTVTLTGSFDQGTGTLQAFRGATLLRTINGCDAPLAAPRIMARCPFTITDAPPPGAYTYSA